MDKFKFWLFQHSRPSSSMVDSRILPNFKLVQDFMPAIFICKFDNELIKNKNQLTLKCKARPARGCTAKKTQASMNFHEDILNGLKVIERTQFCHRNCYLQSSNGYNSKIYIQVMVLALCTSSNVG